MIEMTWRCGSCGTLVREQEWHSCGESEVARLTRELKEARAENARLRRALARTELMALQGRPVDEIAVHCATMLAESARAAQGGA